MFWKNITIHYVTKQSPINVRYNHGIKQQVGLECDIYYYLKVSQLLLTQIDKYSSS